MAVVVFLAFTVISCRTTNRVSVMLPDVPGANRRLLSVIVGTKSDAIRTQESLKVLNYGYQFFDTVRLYKAKEALQTPEVYKGQAKSVNLGVPEDKWITVPKGAGARLKPVLERTGCWRHLAIG